MQEYAGSALETIRGGVEFTYTEEDSWEERIGYYDEGPICSRWCMTAAQRL